MIHDWTRFWTKPDGQISLADQGFLVGPHTEQWLAPLSGDVWPFDEIAARSCLILIGEPGMGKSQALAREAAAIRAAGRPVLEVDLGATREESVLRAEIFEAPEFEACIAG